MNWQGTQVPYFIDKNLLTKEKITELANQHLANGPLFVTGVRVGSDNHVTVFIDGDRGVTISDCVELSRFIEKTLGDTVDFSLDVSSHGASTPLVLPRQYKKHIGRDFEIKLLDGTKAEGTLVECNDEQLKLEYSVREDKPLGKGKVTVTKQQLINYNQIKESKVKLKF
jgi:ribosome maturation factor RimP